MLSSLVSTIVVSKQVRPGDQLRLEVEMTRVRGPIGKGKAIATVDGEIACEAEITFAIGDKRIDVN